MIISLDTEYTELNIRKADLLSVSIGTNDNEYLFKPSDLAPVKRANDKASIIFVQNGVVDWYMLKKSGLELDKSKFIDIMLLEHLIDENLEHSLGAMALRYFGDNYKKEFWGKYQNFQDAPPHEAEAYERKDVRYTYDLGIRFLKELEGKQDLIAHVHKLQWALFDTETRGIRVDEDLIKRTHKSMGDDIGAYGPKLRGEFDSHCSIWELQNWKKDVAKRTSIRGKQAVRRPIFNFSSDSQIRWLVYDSLEIPVKEKTKKGQPSTSTDTLKELSDTYPELKTLVEFKETKSIYSTFVEGMLERVENGYVYPHFNINGTTTGRLSSSNPNFQNMPTDGIVRNFILPDEGCLIVGADFEGLEVGVEGNLTEDPALLSIMLEGANKHDITALAVGMNRNNAKTLNFLCQYGGGVWKIQKTFGVSAKTAQEIYDRYWQAYKGVKVYKEKVFKELENTNKVVNCFGRTRHFNKPKNEYEKAKFERQAYSHMVQGPGAEMTNISTYLIKEYFERNKTGRFMFPVHDECVVSANTGKVDEVKLSIVNIMESTNDRLGFKYKIKAKPYGAFECWKKA